MAELKEALFLGKWRSFKTFRNAGSVRLNTPKKFTEFEFDDSRRLRIKTYNDACVDELLNTNDWKVTLSNRKHFLHAGKMSYEVITINHTVMVLSDPISSEKTFFARNSHWEEFLKSNELPVL
jgi:hypothetical protein